MVRSFGMKKSCNPGSSRERTASPQTVPNILPTSPSSSSSSLSGSSPGPRSSLAMSAISNNYNGKSSRLNFDVVSSQALSDNHLNGSASCARAAKSANDVIPGLEYEFCDLSGYENIENLELIDPLAISSATLECYCNKCGRELDASEAFEHPFSHVTRGSFAQNIFNVGNPCTAIAAVSIVYANKQPVSQFTTATIDNILKAGVDYYKQRREALNTMELNLTATEIAGTFINPLTDEEVTIHVKEEESMNGILDIVTSSQNIPRLHKSIEEFLATNPPANVPEPQLELGFASKAKPRSEWKFAILTTNLLSMALIVQDDWVYLFDSHVRNEYGRTSFDFDNGTACVVSFRRSCAPSAVSEHVHLNCEFSSSPVCIDKMSYEDLQMCQYSITPITVT